jgi:hypothetical protein
MFTVQFFKIFGLAVGINYITSEMAGDSEDHPYKMIQILVFVFGISIIIDG